MLTIFLPKLMFFSAIVEQIYLVNMTLKEQGHCLSKLAISNISICILKKLRKNLPSASGCGIIPVVNKIIYRAHVHCTPMKRLSQLVL